MPSLKKTRQPNQQIDVTTLRLMQKRKGSPGSRHQQSSVKGNHMLAVAGAVEMGLVDDHGLPGLLHIKHSKRVRQLLKKNFIARVKPKATPVLKAHGFSDARRQADQAFRSGLLARHYLNAHTGCQLKGLLSRKRFVSWLMDELQKKKSPVRTALSTGGYDHLNGATRSYRWWYDKLK